MSVIEMNDICFAYNDLIAVSHLSIEIEKGEVVILRGPNGCGKSTLLQIMNGLVFPQRGEYLFQGDAVSSKTMAKQLFAKKFHQQIGYLFQNADIQLFSNSVEEEIAFGALQMGLPDEEVQQRVDHMIALLDIEKLRNRAPYHLSGGEKKKVALASILIVNPRVLIMDEPISGLDPKAQDWMVDFLKQMKQAGKSIIIATHYDRMENEIGDRVIQMEEGGIKSEMRMKHE